MKKTMLIYETPVFEAISAEVSAVLCQSIEGFGNESFNDGNWEW